MRRELHIGVVLGNYGPQLDPETLLGSARAAVAAGCDSVWVTDHVTVSSAHSVTYGNITEAVVSGAFVAGGVPGVTVGISALVVPQRQLVLALKQLVSLDFLSRGRLVTAVAAGWHEEEFAALGADFRGRGRNLETFLGLVRELRDRGPGPVTGASVPDWEGMWFAPAPHSHELKLWSAGNSRLAIRRAAQLGAWHPVGMAVEELRAGRAELRRLNPAAACFLRLPVRITHQRQDGVADPRGNPAIIGPPDWVAEKLCEYVEAGCDGFVVMLNPEEPGLGDRIAVFAEEAWSLVNGAF